MDIDEHLDTSWCPVCDRAILPKRYTVPVEPSVPHVSSSTAVKSSQTTRGKNGTIKARAGGPHGAGRVRPALNRAGTSKAKPAQRTEQQFLEDNAPVRTRTVIDQSPTPLYCSEECRKRDLEDSWPVAPPPAREALAAPRQLSHVQLGEHPAQINPARASPPPPSPTLPPVPPNSWRGQWALQGRERQLNLEKLKASIQEEADEQSDSSSATGTSFTASDRSPIEERPPRIDCSNLYTDPPPPPLAPLPPHPHRPSAPVVSPNSRRVDDSPKFEGGIMMAAKRLQEFFLSGAADDEETKKRKKEEEQRKQEEEQRLRKWDIYGKSSRSVNNKPKEEETRITDPTRWTELVYNYSSNRTTKTSDVPVGVPTTHRRLSDTDPSKRVVAQEVPNRAQSALELSAKYPLFARSSSARNTKSNKSTASIATSYNPAFGMTASSSRSTKSSTSAITEGASALTLPGVDPELYAGKKIGGPRRLVEEGVEGLILVPDVLLRKTLPVSSSLPLGIGPSSPLSKGMRRSESDANVARKTHRSTSALGVVREGEGEVEGVWHHVEEGSEDSRSSVTHSSSSAQEKQSRKGRKSRSSRSAGKQPVVESTTANWSYEKSGPMYDAMPPVPIHQSRCEEVFVPDEPLAEGEPEFIEVSALHLHDVEISRRPIREVRRRRGEHNGKAGWWVEKEWDVRCIPERKRLFLFGGGKPALENRT